MTGRHLIACALLMTAAGAAAQATATILEVRETGKGTFAVIAQFEVDAAPAIVRDVLTDYDRIPAFMPEVRSSIVRSREHDVVVVEQEAVSKFMFFSRTVHLRLQVQEGPRVLAFTDTSKESFDAYSGSWIIDERADGTALTYALTAKPAFAVPDFVLKRLLDRNARTMIDQLRREIALRAAK